MAHPGARDFLLNPEPEPSHFLGYRDSGSDESLRLDNSQALSKANLWEVVDKIRTLIAALQPKILATFYP